MKILSICLQTLKVRLPPEDSSVRRETWPKRVSDDPRHFIFRRPESRKFVKKLKISNDRLPPEDSSVWPETLGKRVSDDPRHFIFRRHKTFFRQKFSSKKNCYPKNFENQ